ncbi:MAG TPA: hypothetical protein VFP87_05070 [Chitinophagaceae bacterium]|nr:hypothetical protein [Chitinophagaceae bacterium]
MSEDLNALNQKIHEEADEILDKKGLRKILAKYGIVHETGSYSLGLMTWRDLDIYIENEDFSVENFFELGKEIVSLLTPVKMSFRNERIARTAGLPPGLYWGIYLGNEREGSWKIDVWALDKEECAQRLKFCEDIAQRISAATRMKILEIKSKCWTDPHYRKFYTSNDIYTAVLENHAHDLDSFKIYLQRKLSV